MLRIALADDHQLLRNGLAELLQSRGYIIALQANNGQELLDKLQANNNVDIVVMDVNMPVMDGFKTTEALGISYPKIRVIALSMFNSEAIIIKMIRAGAKGYLLKDASPTELCKAIEAISNNDFYFNDNVNSKLLITLNNKQHEITDREKEFLELCATEHTYKEIADIMFVSPRTVDGYRDHLFLKLDIKSRTGLVLYAIKNGYLLV
jgi:DNA-binding NarL/FixJ family response regulator